MKNSLYAFVFLFFSCNYSFEPTPEPTRLVVNARLYQDSGLVVHLSRSIAPVGTIDPRQLWVNDGSVTLINDQNQQQITLNNVGNGWYRTVNFVPSVGQSYHVEAKANELPNATSESIIFPNEPIIDSVRFINDPTYDAVFSAKFIRNDIFWKKTPNQKSYYALRNIGFTRDSLVVMGLLSLFNRTELDNFCDGISYSDQFVFSDNCTPNTVNHTKNFVNTSLESFTNFNGKQLEKIQVDIAQVSESFFKYATTADQPERFGRAFAEPKINYSNIKNGYGVFVAIHSKRFIHTF